MIGGQLKASVEGVLELDARIAGFCAELGIEAPV